MRIVEIPFSTEMTSTTSFDANFICGMRQSVTGTIAQPFQLRGVPGLVQLDLKQTPAYQPNDWHRTNLKTTSVHSEPGK